MKWLSTAFILKGNFLPQKIMQPNVNVASRAPCAVWFHKTQRRSSIMSPCGVPLKGDDDGPFAGASKVRAREDDVDAVVPTTAPTAVPAAGPPFTAAAPKTIPIILPTHAAPNNIGTIPPRITAAIESNAGKVIIIGAATPLITTIATTAIIRV